MTKIYGVVAEFNPFHNGHKIFIDTIKQKYHPDVLIAVMSGNFVQRGDFAVLDKWQRAKLAVDLGVDLVIELPMAFAVQPAELFAQGAMKLLSLLKIDTLVFGTEEKLDFVEMAQKILTADNQFEQNYQQNSATNLTSYYQSLGIDITVLPNQMLGINYVMQIEKYRYPIKVQTILRESGFSATNIRNALNQGLTVSSQVPNLTEQLLKENEINVWNDFYPYLKYQIINSNVSELHSIYQMVEGLEYKLKKEVVLSNDFEDLLSRVKSKRYTMARLRRLMLYTLINVKSAEIVDVYKNPYLRVLGFSETGRKYLNQNKKDLNLITKVGKKEAQTLELEIRADQIFQLQNKKTQDFGKMPYMKGVN
ncbi:nucleotidyltransferase family protein [Companilactobacillus farciminis]|nr:nucleotidyltransferase family protein [Companilactobacillus farciminis]